MNDDITELHELSPRRRQSIQRQWVILTEGDEVKQLRALITLYTDKKGSAL